MPCSGSSKQLVELPNLSEDQQRPPGLLPPPGVGYKDKPRIRLFFLPIILKWEGCRACIDRSLLPCKRLGEISEQQGRGPGRGSAGVPSRQCWTLPLTAPSIFTKWEIRQKWLLYNQGFREWKVLRASFAMGRNHGNFADTSEAKTLIYSYWGPGLPWPTSSKILTFCKMVLVFQKCCRLQLPLNGCHVLLQHWLHFSDEWSDSYKNCLKGTQGFLHDKSCSHSPYGANSRECCAFLSAKAKICKRHRDPSWEWYHQLG